MGEPMRSRILFTGAIAAITVAIAVFLWQRIRSSQDEGPIIVQNGSIDIQTIDGEWKDGNSEWINQTSGTVNSNQLWVKVTSSTGTCRASGKPVQVQYSEPSVHAIFTTSGMWWFAKTRVTPRSGIAFVDGKHLRAGSAGDGGHITEVRAQSQTCSLSPESQNVRITICSSSQVADCQ
jgi:hypothetical protein